jgi:hypothetical protein
MTVRDWNLTNNTRRYFSDENEDDFGRAQNLARVLKAVRGFIKENDLTYVEDFSVNIDGELGWTATLTY